MIYKYTTCESVIAKIIADGDMGDSKLRITDIKEWIFEAVEKIGAPMQYIERESGVDGCPILKIHDYQVPIPCDLEHLSTVAYSNREDGGWIPARTTNASFKDPHKPHAHHHNFINNYEIPCIHEHKHEGFIEKPINANHQLYGINGMKYFEKMVGDRYTEEPVFFIKPGWIVLNKKTGYVKLSYKSVAIDEKGYPLIPDLASYQEAVYWYVMMKLNFPKFLKGKLGGGKASQANANIYTYLQQQWNFYRNQAYAEAMMPTESDMRSIKNEWNKLVPEWDSDEVLFRTEGDKQLNYTDYYYGY